MNLSRNPNQNLEGFVENQFGIKIFVIAALIVKPIVLVLFAKNASRTVTTMAIGLG